MNLSAIFYHKKEPTRILTTVGLQFTHLLLQGIIMDPSQPKTIGHDLGSKQLHNEKLLISSLFAAIQGDRDHGHEMLKNFGPHLASIMTRTINMEHIIPCPSLISFDHGGSSIESSDPSQLTNTSETSNSNLCHSSVGEVAIPPLRGKEGDLSLCPKKTTRSWL